jgi:hypothetical protein
MNISIKNIIYGVFILALTAFIVYFLLPIISGRSRADTAIFSSSTPFANDEGKYGNLVEVDLDFFQDKNYQELETINFSGKIEIKKGNNYPFGVRIKSEKEQN